MHIKNALNLVSLLNETLDLTHKHSMQHHVLYAYTSIY